MILRTAGNVVFAGLGIWLAYYEFGVGVFEKPLFWVFLIWWGYVSFIALILDWKEAGEKSTSEKVDELITKLDEFIVEIRKDRNERNRRKQ